MQSQKIQRYSERWRQTLRDQEPDLDCLPGVRRVTLNHNINIGDVGAVHLVDVLRDDVFLKGEKCMKPCSDMTYVIVICVTVNSQL